MWSTFVFTLLLLNEVVALRFPLRFPPLKSRFDEPISGADDISAPPASISEFNLTIFNQLIDHSNPSLGTFKQRVWSNDKYWAGPGSPVVLFSPGEEDASTYQNYLTNRKISGAIAEEIGGAIVLVEHRYWGESSPYDKLTVKNLQYLTVNNSILDFINIAKNIQLPFDTTNSSQADVAPWVYTGGSYQGSLVVWTQLLHPGTFWAYYASSATVERIFDFWQYFEPIKKGMPANCTKDVELVVNHVDSVLSSGDKANITALKKMFGVDSIDLELSDIAYLFYDAPFQFQTSGYYLYTGYNYTTYNVIDQWCDYVETSASPGAPIPDENGVGLEKALAGYANWTKTIDLPGKCKNIGYSEWTKDSDLGCLDNHNASAPFYTDLRVDNEAQRQWTYMTCSQYPNFQTCGSTPKDTPAIAPRYLTVDFWVDTCNYYFPPEVDGGVTYTYNPSFVNSNYSTKVFDDEMVAANAYTKGWDIEGATERVIFANGGIDPWSTLGVSSTFRPGGPIKSTAKQPIFNIPDGVHTTDLDMLNGQVNSGVADAQNKSIAQIKAWVKEFKKN